MKILKISLIVLLTILALTFLISVFLPQRYVYNFTKTMDVPIEYLSYLSGDLEQLNTVISESGIKGIKKLRLGDKASGEGAAAFWGSKENPSGQLQIQSHVPNVSTRYLIDIKKMMKAKLRWNFEEQEMLRTHTGLNLELEASKPYNILLYFQRSGTEEILNFMLEKLSKYASEKTSKGIIENGFSIKFEEAPAEQLYGIQKNINPTEARVLLRKELQKRERSNPLDTVVMYGLFYEWDEKNQTTRCVVAQSKNKNWNGQEIENFSLPSSRVLSTRIEGDKKNIASAHQAINQFAERLDVQLIAPVVEKYQRLPQASSESMIDIYYLYWLK